jgi:hypothetical protein
MTCTAVTNFGSTMYIKLASADCSAPVSPPLMLGVYSDAQCTYGDYPVGGPTPSISVPWVFERPLWSTTCWPRYWVSSGLSQRNSTSITVAADGSATIKIFGASDATCSGPVYSSFVGVTAQAGDSQASGKCTAATTGAANFAQSAKGRSSGWVRLFRAPPAPFATPNGPTSPASKGVFVNFFNDSSCRFPSTNGLYSSNGGWVDAAHTITEFGWPTYAGYCNGGVTVTGGNAALGWASTAWFAGNDCDSAPTQSVMLSTATCATVKNFGATYYIKLGPNPDIAIPASPPLLAMFFPEPTCTYQPFETPGVLGGTTFTLDIYPQPYCVCGFVWDGSPDAPNNNCSTIAVDPVTRVATVSVYNYANCNGPVLSSWVMPSEGNTQYAGTCSAPATGAARYRDPMNATRIRVFEQATWPFSVATTAKSSALTGVQLQLFGDETCSGAPWTTYTISGGGLWCEGGMMVTSCNAAQGWAQVLIWDGNDCDLAPPTSTWTFSTTECTTVSNFFGIETYIKLGSADCSAPPAPPLELVIYSDPKCTYGDVSLIGHPGVAWATEFPLGGPFACNQGAWMWRDDQPWNSTRLTMSASGSVDIYIYGASDTTCSGPVYATFRDLTYSPGNTRTSGSCTPATTGASLFAQSYIGQTEGWVRLIRAAASPNTNKNIKCSATAPAPGTTVSSSSSADTTTGPTVAGVVVGVFALGGIGAALYFFHARAAANAGVGKLVKNPVGASPV